MPEMSQDPIGPCGPLEQSVGDSFRHCLMKAWSSGFDFGANTVVAVVVYYYVWMGLIRVKLRVMFECGQLWVGVLYYEKKSYSVPSAVVVYYYGWIGWMD
jgi:hypothetical protein